MWNNPLTYCVIAGFGFGAWPFLARFSKLPPTWLAVMMGLGTLTVVGTWTAVSPSSSGINFRSVAICFASGLLNGIGMVAYAKLVGWQDPNVQVSRIVPLTTVIMAGFVLLIGVSLFHEPLTLKKLIGVALAAVAVMLLG